MLDVRLDRPLLSVGEAGVGPLASCVPDTGYVEERSRASPVVQTWASTLNDDKSPSPAMNDAINQAVLYYSKSIITATQFYLSI